MQTLRKCKHNFHRVYGLVAVMIGAALVLSLAWPQPAFSTPSTWSATGSLNEARYSHTATLLTNGRVLVAGGYRFSPLDSAELYDLAANGGVGAWTTTGSLTARYSHTATLLADGRVLVTGGYTASSWTNSAEIFDPAAGGGVGAWSATDDLGTPRALHTATLLIDGRVLVAAGNGTSAELFDPAADGGFGAWSPTDSLSVGRYSHTATRLADGQVLVTGGHGGTGVYLASSELYNPATETWSATGSLSNGRYLHTATLLANGQVLACGGQSASTARTSAERYTPPPKGSLASLLLLLGD